MRYIEPHGHMVSRTTDDYQAMVTAGCAAVCEPAFWAGFDRSTVHGFHDYFCQLTDYEPKRAAKFGLAHYSWLCINPKESEDTKLAEEVISLIPGFLDPEDTARAFTHDGWLATGDLGWLDADGRLNLSGRSKDLIIRGGHNIDPKTIEDALSAHPSIQLCAAVGAPDAYAGELPVVFATLVPGTTATEAELLAFVGERVDEAPARPKAVTIL